MIFIGMELWGPVWRRSHHLMAGYARRFPERKVLFVALPIDVSHGVRTGRREVLAQAQRPVLPVRVEGFTNLYTVRPVKWLPDSLPGGRRFNQSVARAQVRRAARQLHLQRPLLWIKPYWGAHFAGRMGECIVLYDVGDDWTTIRQSVRAMRWAVREDQELTQRADAVLVVSEDLYHRKRALRNEVFLVPNGVDAPHFAAVWQRTLLPHPITSGWQRPVLGYTGMLHAERFDMELTIALARRMPQATLALVGPNLLDATQTARLAAEPNIRLTGPVSYEELPRVMTAFDVCIAPSRINAFSESQNPLKLWEYLASGLPAVATPVNGFRDYPELVYLASTPEAFAAGIDAALHEAPDLPARRQQAVREQTWEARLDTIQQIVRRITTKHSTR
ncbi:MAG: glycosyltransferase [Chthonomonadaceae bacterium]|nr:glycosyltransferase [Chthonomonadaceae bacterium]